MSARWNIEKVNEHTYNVWRHRDDYGSPVLFQVWTDGDTPRCTQCQGVLAAMRANCPHARAVVRFLRRSPIEGQTP